MNSALAPLSRALHKIAKPEEALIVYEAGPCGYGWVRYLRGQGWRCEVIAPSRISRSPADQRIKTDRRDAQMLANHSRAGTLVPIVVPDARDEAIRDLSRAREDARRVRHSARLRLTAMLLRHGKPFNGKSHWTQAHERHLASIRFEDPAQEFAFTEYRNAVKDADARVQRLVEALRTHCADWRMKPVVDALMCMRGFDFLAAVTCIAELGDLTRFAHPRALMSYLGLVPSEFSSGKSRHRGSITKLGNTLARRILIEAAWNYRHKAQISRILEVRQQGQPKAACDISWKCQQRLVKRYVLLRRRGLNQNKTCVAVARELCGFIWDIARQVKVTH